MSLNIIKENIRIFKLNNNFEEKEYNDIFHSLDTLNKKTKGILNFWRDEEREKILEEQKNFRCYIIESLLNNANKATISKNFQLGLTTIKKLENLNPSENEIEIKKINDIKQHCDFNLKIQEGQKLIYENEFERAVSHFKNMKNIYTLNIVQNIILNELIQLAESKYINAFSLEIAGLLKRIEEMDFKEINNNIIFRCEKIIDDYKYKSYLKKKISEIKNKYYFTALELVIEGKIKKNKKIDDELFKYEHIISEENIITNKIEIFKKKKLYSKKSVNKIYFEKNFLINSERKKNIIKENNKEHISLDLINIYLDYINQINEGPLDKKLEEDIKRQIINYNEEIKNTYRSPKNWIWRNKKIIKNNSSRGKVFAFFNTINKRIAGYDIRPIQLISLLFLTKNEPKLGGIFLQINTGEGKSLIIQFLAAYLALLGNKVDIITSSSILAERDCEDEKVKRFYSELGLSSGCASKDQYLANIVYGDTQNFQAGILREEYKGKEIRNHRSFHCVIVDEVDSISLDNIITMTQLTDNFPGRSCYKFFYYSILICYCQIINELPKKTGKSKEYFYQNPNEFKEFIHKEIIKLFIGKILEEDGKHLKKDMPSLYPNCMESNIEESLNTWIDNVIRAPSMIINRDFIIKENIVPVDYSNTGVLQENMVWDGGLQQILQIIHNTKGTFENENTNFLSNISFFKRFKGNIYGVTGTFGGNNFQYILKKVYEVSLYKIPPNKKSNLKDCGYFIFTEEDNYLNKIKDDIRNVVIKNNRSVLLISNSIAEGEKFYTILKEDYGKNAMKYFTEDDKETIEKVLNIRKIIVATNLAGRGTDIKISEELERNGGLHVLVSFLPLNQRIEEQNYGRAGRKGQKGSHVLIMLYKNEYGILNNDELNINNLKKIRDEIELRNINHSIENDMKQLLQKEEIFSDFCSYLKKDCKYLNTFQKMGVEEKWGIILKNKNISDIKKKLEQLKKENKKEIKNNLIKFREIINNADDFKTFPIKIFELEPKYSWAVKIKYTCLMAKEKINNFLILKIKDKYTYQKKAIEELKDVKENIDSFIGDLTSQSTLNKIVFSFFEKNKELIKNKDFKTKIEKQNDTRKNFLETIKNLIDSNIDTITQYIKEDKSDNTIETDKLMTIEEIIKTTTNISIKDKSDIKIYMKEFGFTTFELLIIKKRKKYIMNLIIIALGVIEICAGAAILMYSANPLFFKLARYLIREGIKDIVKGVKACIEGKELDIKTYGIEKGLSLVGFALDLVVGVVPSSIGETIQEKFLGIVRSECINLAKTYGNRYVANKIVTKLINKMSGKIKEILITPLMNQIKLNGENIDKYIYYDILNNTDEYKDTILKQFDSFFEQMDNLIDFIGPVVEGVKLFQNEKGEKLIKFLEFMSNFDYKGLVDISKKIYNLIKNTKVETKNNNKLSAIIKLLDSTLKENDVDNICKELIECGAIDKEGNLNLHFISIKGFEQCFSLKIDEKYLKYNNDNNKKEISQDLEQKILCLALKLNKNSTKIENRKKEIKDEIYNKMEEFIKSLIERILDTVENKVSEQFEKLWNKYKKKKKINEKQEIKEEKENEEKKEQNNDENNEGNEIKVVKSANTNKINEGNENITIPDLNKEEIQKNKENKVEEEKDESTSMDINIDNKKNKDKEDNKKNNNKNNDINEEKEKEGNDKEKKEKEEKEKLEEKVKTIISEEKINDFAKKSINFAIEFGVKTSTELIFIPKLVNVLNEWFKNLLKEKLLPKLMERFDDHLEKFGSHIIILQKKYNIKDYLNKVLKAIETSFHVITLFQKFINPILRDTISKLKKEKEQNKINSLVEQFNNKLIAIGEENILVPIQEFVDKIFGDKKSLTKYELFEKIIGEGYKKVKVLGVEKYNNFKLNVNEKYNDYKNKYLDKRDKIRNLPDLLTEQYEEIKEKQVKIYNEKKKEFIEYLDKLIVDIKKGNFPNILSRAENIIIDELNKIKNEAKNKIEQVSNIIPNYFNDLINLMDNILKLNFGPFQDNKLEISEHILNFIIEIESGNIKIDFKNETEETTFEKSKKLLIDYLNKKLDIKTEKINDIIEHLIKNGFKSLFIKKINTIINYGQEKLEEIKKYFKPTLNMIKDYFSTLKGDISGILDKCKGKINNFIDSIFEKLIQFLKSKLIKIRGLDIYFKTLTINESTKNELLAFLLLLKNEGISKLSAEFEEVMKSIDNLLKQKLEKIKEGSKNIIKEVVDKAENKVFGFLNGMIGKKEKNEIESENSNSEFNKFDESICDIGKKLDKNICHTASEYEEKILNTLKDSQAIKYLQMKFSGEVDKDKFDNFLNSIKNMCDKEKEYISSEQTKRKYETIDKILNDVVNSKYTEGVINLIDKIDINIAKKVVSEIEEISKLLDSKSKKDFRKDAKELIIKKIFFCYENFVEQKLTELLKDLGVKLVELIDKKIANKKD